MGMCGKCKSDILLVVASGTALVAVHSYRHLIFKGENNERV
jgi:hypothetical protein